MPKALGARGEITRRKITDRQRRARALALRKSGQGYVQIAETLICVECGHNPHTERGCGSDYCECRGTERGRLYASQSSARRAVNEETPHHHTNIRVLTAPPNRPKES